MNAETFNTLYPVGTLVFAYPGARPEDIPSATRLVTRTRTEAQTSSSGTPVVWVDGEGSYIALTHVDPVSEDEWKAAKTAEAVADQGAPPAPADSGPSKLEQVSAEIARFGIYGPAVPAARALVQRADELVTENAELRARLAVLETAAGRPVFREWGVRLDSGHVSRLPSQQAAREDAAELGCTAVSRLAFYGDWEAAS